MPFVIAQVTEKEILKNKSVVNLKGCCSRGLHFIFPTALLHPKQFHDFLPKRLTGAEGHPYLTKSCQKERLCRNFGTRGQRKMQLFPNSFQE